MFATSSNHLNSRRQEDDVIVRKPLTDSDYESDCETAPLSWSSLEVSSPVTVSTSRKKKSEHKDKESNKDGDKPDFISSFSCVESPSSSKKSPKPSPSKRSCEEKKRSSSIKSPKPSKKNSDEQFVCSLKLKGRKELDLEPTPPKIKNRKRSKSMKKSKSLGHVFADSSSTRQRAKSFRKPEPKNLDLEASPKTLSKRSKSMKKSKSLGNVSVESSSSRRITKPVLVGHKQDGSTRKSSSLENVKESPKRRHSKREKANRNKQDTLLDLDSEKEKTRRSKSKQKTMSLPTLSRDNFMAQKTRSLRMISGELPTTRPKSLRGGKRDDFTRKTKSLTNVFSDEVSSSRQTSMRTKTSKSSEDSSSKSKKRVDKKRQKNKMEKVSNNETDAAQPSKTSKISVDKFQALLASSEAEFENFLFESLFASDDDECEYEEIIDEGEH